MISVEERNKKGAGHYIRLPMKLKSYSLTATGMRYFARVHVGFKTFSLFFDGGKEERRHPRLPEPRWKAPARAR